MMLHPEMNNDEFVSWAFHEKGGLGLMSDRMDEFQQRTDDSEARAAQLEAERDEWKAACALGQANCDAAYDDLRAERDEWKELYLLRSKAIDDLVAERDGLRRQLEQARKLIEYVMPSVQPYMVTQLRYWLEDSAQNEAQK